MRKFLVVFTAIMLHTSVKAEHYIVGAQNISYFPHYAFQSPIDKGLAWAILEAYAEKSGHTFDYVALPIVRLRKELVKGNVDIIYPDNPKWFNSQLETDNKYYSSPLVRALGGTIVTLDKQGKGIDAVKRLGLPAGFSPVKWQSRIESKQTKLIPAEDSLSALLLLAEQQADAVDLEYNVASYLSRNKHKLSNIRLDPSLPFDDVGFRLATIKHKRLIDGLNQFLIEDEALVESLKRRYNIEDPNIVISRLQRQQQN